MRTPLPNPTEFAWITMRPYATRSAAGATERWALRGGQAAPGLLVFVGGPIETKWGAECGAGRRSS
jgi:hypothetical protein